MSPKYKTTLSSMVIGMMGCLVVALPVMAESISLKPKHDPASEIYVEHETDSVQKMSGPDGKPMEIKSRSVYGVLQKSTARGDKVEIEVTIDRMLGFMSFIETMKSLYDTDEPDYEEAAPMYKDTFEPLMNMSLKITLDGSGVATAVEGGEPMRKKLADMGEQNFVAKTLLEGDFTDRQIMSVFGELPVILCPDRDVKPGDTWKKVHKDEYPQVGRVFVNYECKLDGIEKAQGRELATVSFSGVITKDPDEKPAKDKRLGKIDGKVSGTAKFDVAQGRFVDIKRETTAKVEVPPWWTKDEKTPLMKIDVATKNTQVVFSAADRRKHKAEIAGRIAAAQAKREAEEAAAMAGPVDPPTPANEPVAWLQWGGTRRNFHSEATGLANRWPKDGPPKLWERQLGDGFSAILSDGDTLYTMYSIRNKEDQFQGDEVVVALDAKTGKTRWEHKYAAPWPKDFQMEFGPGPHSTPIVVGDRIFTVGCTAQLHCLDKKTGDVLWSKDLHKEYKAELHMRGYGSSPMAHKGNILLPVSKEKGHAIMAFSQSDGSVAWKGGDFEPGYASLLPITAHGVEQIVAFTGKAVMGLDPNNGSTQWSVDHPTQWSANISTPVWGDDDYLFISSAYGMGSRGVKLEKKGSQITAKEAWFSPKMKIQHADAVRVGDHVYGSTGDFGPAFLDCINVKTGEMAWRQRGIAKANVVYADGKLIVLDEDGGLYLVKADPTKYRLLAKAPGICKKTAWTVPTLVGRTLYIRDREKIMALDVGAGKSVATAE